jgi:uncharacterized membrane protein HdeD (DUF308 family)
VSPAEEDVLEAFRLWWVFVVVGLASLIAGVILVLKPSNSLATLAVVVGIFLLIDGIAELIRSFGGRVENRALSAIIGVLGVVIGIALIRHPFHGVTAIGLLIGIWLVAAGVVRLVWAIALARRRLLNFAVALLEIIAGIVIVSDPHIGYATLAILTGIWLIINGLATIALGVAVRSVGSEAGISGPPAR